MSAKGGSWGCADLHGDRILSDYLVAEVSHWNHRVIVAFSDSMEPWLCLHEVYYEDDGSIRGWTAGPVRVCGDNKKEIKETLTRMKRALDKPLLMEKQVGRKTTLVEYKP